MTRDELVEALKKANEQIASLQSEKEQLLLDEECGRRLMQEIKDYAIIMLDAAGAIVSWNTGAEYILGYHDEEIVGESTRIIFTPEDQAQGVPEKEIGQAVKEGRAEDKRWHQRKDGSRFWANGILTCLYRSDGSVRGFVKILRDFTDQKRHEEAIEAANERLKRAMQETHHRVKNNLQLVGAMIDMKVMRHQSSLPIEEIKTLNAHVRALASLHDLLTHETQQDSGKATVSASGLIQQLIALVQQTAPDRKIKLELNEALLTSKQATSLALIVNELISNALKHCKGLIEVSFLTSGSQATLAVCDDGDGFPDDFDVIEKANVGLELIERLARWDLQGKTLYAKHSGGGGRASISFPLIDQGCP